ELNLIVRIVPSSRDRVDAVVKELKDFLAENCGSDRPGAAIVFMPYTGDVPVPPAPGRTPRGEGFSPGASKFAAHLEKTLGHRVALYHGKMEDDTEFEDPGNQESQRVAGLSDKESGRQRHNRPLGDLSQRSRNGEQDAFLGDERQVMVATKGFGMG